MCPPNGANVCDERGKHFKSCCGMNHKPGIYDWSLAAYAFRLYVWWKANLPRRLNGSLLGRIVTWESLNI